MEEENTSMEEENKSEEYRIMSEKLMNSMPIMGENKFSIQESNIGNRFYLQVVVHETVGSSTAIKSLMKDDDFKCFHKETEQEPDDCLEVDFNEKVYGYTVYYNGNSDYDGGDLDL